METATLGRWQVSYRNREEFLELKKEIWTRGEYYFEKEDGESNDGRNEAKKEAETESEDRRGWAPIIIDVGAHIGMAALYWLNLWPQARVIAIEANPVNAEVLRRNVEQNHLAGQVEIIERAMVGKGVPGEVNFYFEQEGEWLISGSLQRGAWNGRENSREIKVLSGHLSDYLRRFKVIDCLKIDIEGAEKVVLREAGEELRRVKRLMVEYHDRERNEKAKSELAGLVRFLEERGLEIEVEERGEQLKMISGYNNRL